MFSCGFPLRIYPRCTLALTPACVEDAQRLEPDHIKEFPPSHSLCGILAGATSSPWREKQVQQVMGIDAVMRVWPAASVESVHEPLLNQRQVRSLELQDEIQHKATAPSRLLSEPRTSSLRVTWITPARALCTRPYVGSRPPR